jgi:hypothetical protein
MARVTIREWAEAYRAFNAAREADERRRLENETPVDSLRSYFALWHFLLQVSPDLVETLAAEREEHHRALTEQLRRAAQAWGYDLPA